MTRVTKQAELDAAIAAGSTYIEIDSPAGVWLALTSPASSSVVARGSSSVVAWESSRVEARESSSVVARGSSRVVAWESSRVVARESSRVEARGSSRVEARGSSRVVARESSRVVAWESSRVEAWESSSVVAWGSSRVVARGSSRVVARGSSSVEVWGSSRVVARESSRVVAWESSRVEAWESSSVEARESSRVVAWESSRVEAWESSSVVASSLVAIHLHSSSAVIKGGVLIDVTKVNDDPQAWCDYHGVAVSKAGVATLYKAVNDKWTTDHGFDYSPGKKPSAPDWRDDDSCGGGLHFGPTPKHAREYNLSATRFVEVGVKVADLRPISGGTPKAKVPKVVRACVEVDEDGKRVAS